MGRHRGRHRADRMHHSTLRMKPITLRRRRLESLRTLLAGARPGW
ncbi:MULTISPECIES: hypothetical protein [unclassified Pseudonocardia]|nr:MULTISPECIES: hypothetical protein [unclassified Pseudonocardia]OLM11256.1 hypothetical protein Ae505Ps2_1379 [Pseudonocardia sp. Ae505_Ps2]